MEEERPEQSIDHPDLDYYRHSKWINELIFFIIIDMVITSIVIIGFFGTANLKLVAVLTPTLSIWDWLPFSNAILLYFFVLFSLQLSDTFALLPGSELENGPLWIMFSRYCRTTREMFPWILLAAAIVLLFATGHIVLGVVAGWYIFLCLVGWIVMTKRQHDEPISAEV